MADSVTVQVDRLALMQALRTDCVTFLSFYLGPELTLEVPDFHQEIWHELLVLIQESEKEQVQAFLKKLFGVPREHAKSTLAKLAAILFLKYTDLSFVLYVSKTNGVAKNAIRDIIHWLSSENETRLFGQMKLIKSSETESLWIVEIGTTRPDGALIRKVCIFRALGSEQQVRGLLVLNRRPEIIIIDDVEDLDNTRTPELQVNLDEWVMGSLLKSRARRAIVLFLGNMIRKTTLLARLAKDPEWKPTVFGCLVRNRETRVIEPLWKGRHTTEALLADYETYKRLGLGHVWECEMMNLTQEDVNLQDMSVVRIISTPMIEQLEAGGIVLDPAFGQEKWHDDSAITVHARLNFMVQPAIIDSWVGKAREELIFDRMLEMSYRWGLYTWFIEAEAAQRLLIALFDTFIQIRRMPREMILMIPITSSKNSKSSRILAFRNALLGDSYAVSESQQPLLQKLSVYDPNSTEKDDYEDSAAYGSIIWAQHERVMKARGVQRIPLSLWTNTTGVESRGQLDTVPY